MAEVRGFVYSPFPGAPWIAMVGTPGGRPFSLLPPWPKKDGHYRDLGNFPTQEAAFAAAEIALFDAKHPNCCHRCGWSLSSHGRSLYGLNCPWGVSPAGKAGHLRIVRRAEERLTSTRTEAS